MLSFLFGGNTIYFNALVFTSKTFALSHKILCSLTIALENHLIYFQQCFILSEKFYKRKQNFCEKMQKCCE